MTSMQVWTEALLEAGTGWREQQEKLRGARTDLAGADGRSGSLGPRVAPAVAVFLNTWIVELAAQRNAAEAHADALEVAATNYDDTDVAAAEELAGLLAWGQRDMRPDS